MMTMNSMTLRTAALLLFTSLIWSCATANRGAVDCCLKTSKHPIPANIVKSYSMQTVDGGCRIPATLFVTRKNRELCAPLPEEEPWVEDLIKKLNNRPISGKRSKSGKRAKRLSQ